MSDGAGIRIAFPGGEVRDYRTEDAPSLAAHANDRRIWINLRDAFPHPYALHHAEAFIAHALGMQPRQHFAIAVEGKAVGGIGFTMHPDVERASVEIGYWLGVAFWGRGITTGALRALTAHVFAALPEATRIYAVPFAWNPASARVLEKSGYHLEGRLRQSVIKDGQVTDQLQYAIGRGDLTNTERV